jgi:hypothetical protein
MATPLTPDAASAAVAKMALMAFFPGDPDIRAALVSVFMDMIDTEEQMEWLVKRALRLYARWPGVAEIRALYCSRWKPKDGIEAYSSVYIDGIPSERNQSQLEPVLPRGRLVTADADLDQKVKQAAESKALMKRHAPPAGGTARRQGGKSK